MTTPAAQNHDADARKGAVEQESRDQKTNTSLSGQMQHRNKSPMADTLDTDFPEPGMSPEHTGQTGADEQGSRQTNTNSRREQNPEAEQQDQDPGERQKRNQGDKKDDSLVA